MEGTEQVTVQFRVVSCTQLPRTNFIGSIDPYVRVYFDDQVLGETRHLKNVQEPVWEEDFFFDVNRNEDGFLCGVVRLELYDENRTRQDELVGTFEVDLSEVPPESVDPCGQQQIQFFDYSWSYQRDKRGEKLSKQGLKPQVTVAILGAIPSWSSLLARLEGYEENIGLLVDEDSHQLYVPIPEGEGAGLYGGVQYLLPRAVHFKLVTTSKQHAGLQLDFRCSKARTLRVERCTYNGKKRRLLRGLRVSAEATLTNLPLSTDLSKLHLVVTRRRAVMTANVAELLEANGFPRNPTGTSLSYKRVAKDMVGASSGDAALETHDEEPCVLLSVGKPPHKAMLLLDYKEGGSAGGSAGNGSGGPGRRGGFLSGGGGGLPKPVLRVLTVQATTETRGRMLVHDFMSPGVETSVTISDEHRKPIKILEGRYEVVKSSELPGAFDEDKAEAYDSAAVLCYSLESEPIAACRFLDLFKPPPEEEEEDDTGTFFGFNPDNMPHSMGSVGRIVAAQGSKVVKGVVGQLGQLVGSVGIGEEGSTAAGSTGGKMLNLIKAPLKVFRSDGGHKERARSDNGREDASGAAGGPERTGSRGGGGAGSREGRSSSQGRTLSGRTDSRSLSGAAGGGGGGSSWKEKLRNGGLERTYDGSRDRSVAPRAGARGVPPSRPGRGGSDRHPKTRFDEEDEEGGYEDEDADDYDGD